MIKEILEYNKRFVEEKKYEDFATSKYPDKRIAIVTAWTRACPICFRLLWG